MARPVTTRRRREPGYEPPTTNSPALGVYAPLNVAVKKGGAAQLAEALGLALDIAAPQVINAIERKTKESFEQGASDAALGVIDAARREKDEAYSRGAYRVEVERQTLEVLSRARDAYVNNFDKTQGPAELARFLDDFMKGELSGLETDPEAARVMAPLVSRFMNQITGEHWELQTQQRIARSIETKQMRISEDIASTGTTDYQAHVADITALIGDRSKAVRIVIDAIGQEAVNRHDPSIIDRAIPESITLDDGQTIAGPRSVPAHAESLQRYRDAAQNLLDKDLAVEKEVELANLTKRWTDLTNNGLRLSWERDILPHVQNGDISRGEAIRWYNENRVAVLGDQQLAADMQLLAAGGRWQLAIGTQDAFGKRYTPERFQNAFDSLVSSVPADQRVAVAIELGSRHSLPYTPLKAQLNSVIATDDALVSNLQLYTQLRDTSPELLGLYVDERNAARYEAMLRMLRAGMKPAEIREEMEQRDPAEAEELWRRHRSEVQKLADEDFEIEVPGFFNDTKKSSLANSTYVSRRVEQMARHLLEQGVTADPEEAVEEARKRVLDTHFVVNLTDDRQVLVERWEGAPQDFSEMMEYVRKQWIPEAAEALGVDPADGAITLDVVPSSGNAREFVLKQNGIRIPRARYSFEALYEAYTKAARSDAWKSVVAHREKVRKIREAQQAERFPFSPYN